MSKVCIVSCSPFVPSGYGQGTKDLIEMLLDLGHECCVYSTYGQHGFVTDYQYKGKHVNIYPSNPNAQYDLTDLKSVKMLENYDFVLSFLDLFVFNPAHMQDYWAAILMVDASPFMTSNLSALAMVNAPVVVSDWAAEIIKPELRDDQCMQQYRLPCNEYDYYMDSRAEAREWAQETLKIPGRINRLVCFNGANYCDGGSERKNMPELIKWWAKHSKANKDDYLYLHTDVTGKMGKGSSVEGLLNLYGAPVSNVRFSSPIKYRFGMHDREYLRNIYNAADIMLVPSHSEGHGFPYVEAAMCGCIPVGNDWGTGKEVLEACNGVTIDCREQYFTKCSVKSRSYDDDIEKAVSIAFEKSDSSNERAKCTREAKGVYSLNARMKSLDDLITKCMSHKAELSL
jgi:hypothetical protein